jgi:cobalt-zinc-cadmium efflux system outer membrane protein
MTRALAIAIVIVWSTAAWAEQLEPASAPPVSLQQLEELALRNNPTARQAQAAVDAARGRARQAGAWPNPVIGYVGEEIAAGEIIQRGAHGFFVDQTFLLGGKLRRNRTVFEREVDQAQSVQEQQRLRILSSVRTLFYDALTTERRVAVLDRLAQLAAEAVGISRQLYNVGAADQPDVLESNIEARRAQVELTAARNDLTAVRWQLASIVGDRSTVTRSLVGSIEEAIPELERDATIQLLIERSPEIRAARAGAERARAVVSSARRQTTPDLFVRGGMQYNRERLEVGTSAVGWQGLAEIGVSVPLFNRNQGLVAAARAGESGAEAERRRLEFNLESRAAVAFSAYLTALRASEVYRAEILPQAEEAYRLYLARYREAAAAYPQVLIAQRTLFDMTAEYFDHLEQAWQAGLRLQGFLVGEGLDAPDPVGEPIGVAIEIPSGGER